MHLFLSDHAEYSLKFSNMQSELTTNRLLDKLINISLTDSFILEEEGFVHKRSIWGPSALPITFIPILKPSQTGVHSQSL